MEIKEKKIENPNLIFIHKKLKERFENDISNILNKIFFTIFNHTIFLIASAKIHPSIQISILYYLKTKP